jgi:membrane-associated protein
MNFREFFFYNVVGGFLWSFGLLLGGFFLGQAVPDVDRYILPIVLVIIVLSFLPGIVKYRQEKKRMMRERTSENRENK